MGFHWQGSLKWLILLWLLFFSISKDCRDHSQGKDAEKFLPTFIYKTVAKIKFYGLLVFLYCKPFTYLNGAVGNVCTLLGNLLN